MTPDRLDGAMGGGHIGQLPGVTRQELVHVASSRFGVSVEAVVVNFSRKRWFGGERGISHQPSQKPEVSY